MNDSNTHLSLNVWKWKNVNMTAKCKCKYKCNKCKKQNAWNLNQITGSRESVSADDREGDPELNVGEVFRQVEAIHSPTKSVKVKSHDRGTNELYT